MAKKIENKPKKKLKVIEQTKEIRTSRKPLKTNDKKKKTCLVSACRRHAKLEKYSKTKQTKY